MPEPALTDQEDELLKRYKEMFPEPLRPREPTPDAVVTTQLAPSTWPQGTREIPPPLPRESSPRTAPTRCSRCRTQIPAEDMLGIEWADAHTHHYWYIHTGCAQ